MHPIIIQIPICDTENCFYNVGKYKWFSDVLYIIHGYFVKKNHKNASLSPQLTVPRYHWIIIDEDSRRERKLNYTL